MSGTGLFHNSISCIEEITVTITCLIPSVRDERTVWKASFALRFLVRYVKWRGGGGVGDPFVPRKKVKRQNSWPHSRRIATSAINTLYRYVQLLTHDNSFYLGSSFARASHTEVHKQKPTIFFIVAPCTLLRLFLLYQLIHTSTHFKNTSSH